MLLLLAPPALPGLRWAAQSPLGPLPALSSHNFRYKAVADSIALAAAAEEEVVRTLAVAVEEETVRTAAAAGEDTAVCTLGPASGPELEHCPHIFLWHRRPVTLWAGLVDLDLVNIEIADDGRG